MSNDKRNTAHYLDAIHHLAWLAQEDADHANPRARVDITRLCKIADVADVGDYSNVPSAFLCPALDLLNLAEADCDNDRVAAAIQGAIGAVEEALRRSRGAHRAQAKDSAPEWCRCPFPGASVDCPVCFPEDT